MQLVAARGAQKTRNDSKKLQMYSKQWLPGDTMRLFIPVFQNDDSTWDIAVGAIWGHNVNDFEGIGLKTAFIPSLTDFDENGEPIGPPDITYQFSQIAKVFIDGQKQLEEQRLQDKKWPTEAARKEALQKLEYKYDSKNNMNAVKPAIGRATYFISTEVLCMKFTNNIPQSDSAAVVSFPMSNQKIDQLYGILTDPKYAPSEGDQFFEVEWKYPSNPDKGQSAKSASPAGLTAEYRLQTTHPDVYKTISGMFQMVSRDSVSIVRRATRRIDEAKIRGAITQYSYVNSENIDACTPEDEDTLIRNAQLIHELSLEKAMANTELIEKINAELAKKVAEPVSSIPDLSSAAPAPAVDLAAMQNQNVTQNENLGAATAPAADLGAATAPAMDLGAATAPAPAVDLTAQLSGVQGAPNIQQLMNNSLNSGMDDAMLEKVDLDMM
ncbi:MAG: hypothetical protein NC548_30720 [Lachnospiraceae bacterium]|nr:hypothetical protein [Lachnospiraceae bacterium]